MKEPAHIRLIYQQFKNKPEKLAVILKREGWPPSSEKRRATRTDAPSINITVKPPPTQVISLKPNALMKAILFLILFLNMLMLYRNPQWWNVIAAFIVIPLIIRIQILELENNKNETPDPSKNNSVVKDT